MILIEMLMEYEYKDLGSDFFLFFNDVFGVEPIPTLIRSVGLFPVGVHHQHNYQHHCIKISVHKIERGIESPSTRPRLVEEPVVEVKPSAVTEEEI